MESFRRAVNHTAPVILCIWAWTQLLGNSSHASFGPYPVLIPARCWGCLHLPPCTHTQSPGALLSSHCSGIWLCPPVPGWRRSWGQQLQLLAVQTHRDAFLGHKEEAWDAILNPSGSLCHLQTTWLLIPNDLTSAIEGYLQRAPKSLPGRSCRSVLFSPASSAHTALKQGGERCCTWIHNSSFNTDKNAMEKQAFQI